MNENIHGELGYLQVLGHVSGLIHGLHQVGYVHRDLKPQNIMWERHTGLWVLIDFDLVARIGRMAVVGFTPSYAAPEAVRVHRSANQSMIVGPELDAWAFGVVAMEVVLGAPPLGYNQDLNEVLCSVTNSWHCLHTTRIISSYQVEQRKQC